ncbi:hypothetical protein [Paludifilum halophilum]|nr:hypothetical protein [Paludifilum halophilum]
MSRTELNVTLIGYTQMSEKFAQKLVEELELEVPPYVDGRAP